MRKTIIIALAIAALSSCTFIRIDTKALRKLMEEEGIEMGNGKIRTVNLRGDIRNEVLDGLSGFTAIRSGLPIDIEYSCGDQHVSISAPSDLFEYLDAKVVDSTLVLGLDGVRIRNAGRMTAVIRTPRLNSITVNGAGDVDVNGHVEAEDFRVSISGAGDVSIDDITAKAFGISVSGAGDIDIDRIICDSFESEINGAGEMEVEGMEAGKARVWISGAGNCEFAGHVGEADFSVSGTGVIDIQNLKVDKENTRTSGLAKIIR